MAEDVDIAHGDIHGLMDSLLSEKRLSKFSDLQSASKKIEGKIAEDVEDEETRRNVYRGVDDAATYIGRDLVNVCGYPVGPCQSKNEEICNEVDYDIRQGTIPEGRRNWSVLEFRVRLLGRIPDEHGHDPRFLEDRSEKRLFRRIEHETARRAQGREA